MYDYCKTILMLHTLSKFCVSSLKMTIMPKHAEAN